MIIGTTQPVDYQLTKISDKRLRLDLLDTTLPEYRNRALITTRFQSAVDRITPTQRPETNDTVIVIELREAVPYLVKQTDRIIRVDFSASSIPPKPYEDGQIPAWKRVLTEPDAEPSTATAIKATKAEQTEKFGNKDFGKKHSSTQGQKGLIVEEATEAKKLIIDAQTDGKIEILQKMGDLTFMARAMPNCTQESQSPLIFMIPTLKTSLESSGKLVAKISPLIKTSPEK